MKVPEVTGKFKTEDDGLEYSEAMRWPDGEFGGVRRGEMGRTSQMITGEREQQQAHPPVQAAAVQLPAPHIDGRGALREPKISLANARRPGPNRTGPPPAK